ncbi:MAG TPA: serine hydrolase domain-containing protein [Flavobacterium sp.]|jgi:CubicO group peptidase (beta-lactamase class C family)
MKQTFRLLTLFSMTFFISCNSFGQGKDNYSTKIDSLIQTTNPRSFNGVILITQKGNTKYSKAFGYSNFEKKASLTTKDNFIIMSNSKQITAVLILKELEKGKIDLQSPVRKYLPELKQSWADTVTVHQLLNFSAGITDIEKPLIFKPGTDFKYGDINYIILGKIIEKVTGRKYSDIANNLFKELKLHNTFCFEQGKTQNRVQGYRNTDNTFKLVENPIESNEMVPAAGIISNVKDLNIWDTKLHKGKILRPETYQLMINYVITAQHNAFGKEKIGYGYGIRISDKTPVKYVGHTGGGSGFVSFKVYFPNTDVDVVILENQSNKKLDLFYEFEIKIKEIIMNSNLMKK